MAGGRFGRFNIPIGGSIVDVFWIIIAILIFAYVHYHSGIPFVSEYFGGPGLDKRAAARQNVVDMRNQAQAELNEERNDILELHEEIRRTEAERDSLARVLEVRQEMIPREVQSIQSAQEKSQRLTAEFLRLRGRLGSQQDKLRDSRLEVESLTETANELSLQESALRDTVFGENQERLALADSVEAARAYRERDPWSIFPVSASLAAYYEFSDAADFLTFSLAKDFLRKGKFDFGINGNVGFGNEQGSSQLEAGVYANYELIFRRASIDMMAGVSSLRTGTQGDNLEPYLAAKLRFAPYYRERAFLLLGGKYSHDTLSGFVGVAFGRR